MKKIVQALAVLLAVALTAHVARVARASTNDSVTVTRTKRGIEWMGNGDVKLFIQVTTSIGTSRTRFCVIKNDGTNNVVYDDGTVLTTLGAPAFGRLVTFGTDTDSLITALEGAAKLPL